MNATNRIKRQHYEKMQPKQEINVKEPYFVFNIIYFIIFFFIFILIFLFNTVYCFAQASGDYRSKVTGNWNAIGTWETYNGSSWVNAVTTPTSASGVITIQNIHTVSVSANVTVDEVIVDAGGAISINNGRTLTIANGTGNDLTVNGTLTINGTLTNQSASQMQVSGLIILKNGGANTYPGTATININSGGRYRAEDASMTVSANHWTVQSGGVYQHNLNGAAIPVATWVTGSTCEVTGVVSSYPNGLNQTFENFIWNSVAQTSIENLQGNLTSINGDFTVASTGSGSVRLGEDENYTLNIGGNFYFQGGNLFATTKANSCVINLSGNYTQTGGTFAGTDARKDNGDGEPTINVSGNISVTSGTFDFSQYTGSSSSRGRVTLNLSGNFTQEGGTITETATNTGRGNFNFTKSGTQYFSKTSGIISNTINFTINNGSIVDIGENIITSDGTFTLQNGGGLNIGSADGITQTSAIGNIQVTGTRTYNTGGNYTYNGLVAQVTGNGLPSTVNQLTVNNSNHVSLTNTVSINNALTFTTGNIITVSDTLIVGTSTSSLGVISRTSGHVVGYLKRWFAAATATNILFPVGSINYYQGINYSYTVAPVSAGSITASYDAIDPGKNGLILIDATDSINSIGYGLWTSTSGNGLSGGTFNVDITATALPNVLDFTRLHILRRANSSSPWTIVGVHTNGTGNNAIPVIHRTGLTLHGQFGIGSGTANPLPIELIYFKAKLVENIVKLTWATASELNNDYFTIERSSDGIHFEEIIRQRGAGNNTYTIYYKNEDKNPLKGYNFYRLKQTDYDGLFIYSAIETIVNILNTDDVPDLEIISISPNPFSNSFNVSFLTKKIMEIDISFINSAGQVVNHNKIKSIDGFNSYEFSDYQYLNKGVYYLYLIYNGQKISRKIIKS